MTIADSLAHLFLYANVAGHRKQMVSEQQDLYYPLKYFNLNCLNGDWIEVARTPNPVQHYDGCIAYHKFKNLGNGNYDYMIVQGDKTIFHNIQLDKSKSGVNFSVFNNGNWKLSSNLYIIGIYDDKMMLVIDNSKQNIAYIVLGKANKYAWLLAQNGYNDQIVNDLIKFCNDLGYKMAKLVPVKLEESKPDESIIQSEGLPNIEASENSKVLLWGQDMTGNPNTLTINEGDIVLFAADDEQQHNLVEADDNWQILENPRIDCRNETTTKFQKKIKFNEPGMYNLVCSIHPDEERVKINVLNSNENKQVEKTEGSFSEFSSSEDNSSDSETSSESSSEENKKSENVNYNEDLSSKLSTVSDNTNNLGPVVTEVSWNSKNFENCEYAEIAIKTGDILKFISNDEHEHNIKQTNKDWEPLDSYYDEHTKQNFLAEVEFNNKGVYRFICGVHPYKRLKVKVYPNNKVKKIKRQYKEGNSVVDEQILENGTTISDITSISSFSSSIDE